MALEDASALKNYLKKKLETLKNGEKTQMTLIVLWLIEIYQNRLGRLREGKEGEEGVEFRNLQEEFLSLLRQPRVEECMKNNKDTVYALLGSHGDQRNLVYIAQVYILNMYWGIHDPFTGVEGHGPTCSVQPEEQTVFNCSHNSDTGNFSRLILSSLLKLLNSDIFKLLISDPF